MPLTIGDIYKRDGVAWIVTAGGPRPAAVAPDPSDRGPIGPAGADGRDGAPGPAGIDGVGWRFKGAWRSNAEYVPNDVVSFEGETWLVVKAVTKSRPDASRSFSLVARAGRDGKDGSNSHSTTRIVRENTSSSDIELAFLEDVHAGQPVYLEENDSCGVTNTLSHWRSKTLIGFAVNDTIGGSRGLVRTAGLIVVPQTLSPGWNYFLSGRGGLCTSGEGVSVVVHAGVAVRSDTLLIRPEVLHYTRDVLTANGSGPKGAPVYLSGPDSVDLASMPNDWQVVGVLTEEASGTATFAAIADVVQSDWSAVLEDESTTLTPNQRYYLSETPGRIATDSEGRKFIGIAKSTTKLAFGSEGNERNIVG
ncbi:collagen-like triple helix repeat-containing protein [Lacipirellula parvula]|nr:collagen-like protein [Lacipirellula parvula]